MPIIMQKALNTIYNKVIDTGSIDKEFEVSYI